jgi:mono/diheme cytochrome c family protein
LRTDSRFARCFAALALLAPLGACRQDMHQQPKVVPFGASAFFADGRGARAFVEGAVPRGEPVVDALLHTGKTADGKLAEKFPFVVTGEVLRRGRERYDIYCSPCHARTGDGDGMIVRRGYRRPPSFHDERLRSAPPGHFVDVVTNGFGAMPDYAAQVAPRDRWAIVAYIRALQLSQHAALGDVPPDERKKLEGE